MGRRKQSRPHRSGGILPENPHLQSSDFDAEESTKSELDIVDNPFFVEVDRASSVSDNHLDISEIVLSVSNSSQAFPSCLKDGDSHESSKYSLRFRLCNISKVLGRLKLGNWPVLPSSDIALEFFQSEKIDMEMKEIQPCSVLLQGTFDGPDEGISCLVHLVSLKFMSLRPVLEAPLSKNLSFLRLRVEILHNAFDACDSLLDTSRKLWKKSMMNVMAWLRPEVVTSEARYGLGKTFWKEADEHHLENEARDSADNSTKHAKFDVALFYEDIKPSKTNPMLDSNMPDLLVELRPYQRRAAYWMVEREKGDLRNIDEGEINQFISPLCMPLEFLDSHSKMFYNPFSGNISLQRESFLPYVHGGILADEMGMGKTVELLACIISNRMSESNLSVDNESPFAEYPKNNLKRLKRERVECSCGAVSENHKYKGLWVQCDMCDAWQHAACVGYSTKGRTLKSREVSGEGEDKMGQKRKNGVAPASVRDDEYICQPCSELSQATDSPVATGATLIVCPAPILLQWHYEIKRHTRPGSIKTYIYEGVREISLSNASLVPMSNLIDADIVLTTYDVLKEDLSHDSDRHEGDRRFMRFQKRYPVLPTLLTRIFWWRVCLDEAQMVESNAGAATEMASRLHAKHHWCITGTPIQRKLDDLYGLLRFIQSSPFNIMRWWVEVIRDPYERRDDGAMHFTHKFFKQIMWRSSKRYVADELQLPPQEECLTWLTFSPIEKYFYQRQHESCVSFAREVIESLKDDKVKRKVPGYMTSEMQSDFVLTQADVGKLLSTLLKLRQACCHPQVGSSGLRSLQQSPMTMEEILMVLVGKTKVEGEEALRRTVVALNALAGIAILENRFSEAVSIYEEALSLAEEHSEDFRLDPLLNIHTHHNLSDILPLTRDHSTYSSKTQTVQGNSEILDEHAVKKQKVSESFSIVHVAEKQSDSTFNLSRKAVNGGHVFDEDLQINSSFNDDSLRKACENLRQKYLAMFTSKLSVAQQEFRKSYTQICSTLSLQKKEHEIWWLEALHYADHNKDFSIELMRKIEEAILGTQNKSQSRIASRFASINILKYHVQTGLDHLQSSRKVVLDRILEIDQTMENPKDEDIERVRSCQNCQADSTGPPCVLCELDELFQDYEARLFRLSKVHGGAATSVEEAVKFQKKKSALNRFYWSLSQQNKNSNSWHVENEESTKRDVGEKFMVSKQPSELEVVLGIIKSYCKVQLGKDGILAANNQLQLLESMRKEYAHARSLAIAQAQVLNAYDELKMATTRLCLSEDDNDKSVQALSEHELPAANVQYSSDKFVSLTLLMRIKGKLRYLKGLFRLEEPEKKKDIYFDYLVSSFPSIKISSISPTTERNICQLLGLVLSKQIIPLGNPDNLSLTEEMTSLTTSKQNDEGVPKAYEETCPVCQEKLSGQKMVFQCGHITCCKCFFAMSEQKLVQTNCVTCPTCRQLTDFGNIAYADDSHNKSFNPSIIDTKLSPDEQETAMKVQGSYGTKIEAVTRRILWIKSTDPQAKVLVFSSWNDVLDVLEHAFTANEINYIRMKGGRKSHVAISKFRGQNTNAKETFKTHVQSTETTTIQVLLLLIQHGANGLNLLEAQHVVLVEPLLNPAVEAQAISRVHRIGQEKKTLVHRFIVKDTVEESIYKLSRSRDISSFITGNVKNKDESLLTLKDVELLFATVSQPPGEDEEKPSESLRHLPPSVAATMAAQRRLEEHTL